MLHISGAGPAGLAAAITCARAGGKVVVHERKQTVGSRFHGDVQGQENCTDMADGAYTALSDDLAPKGYAYLLIHQGQATLAICIFDDFHSEHVYLERSVNFFQQQLGFSIGENARRFGGLGNISYPATARKGNMLYAGEAAGFQDALWGFGMRYAQVSGHLAAQAWLQGSRKSTTGCGSRRWGEKCAQAL